MSSLVPPSSRHVNPPPLLPQEYMLYKKPMPLEHIEAQDECINRDTADFYRQLRDMMDLSQQDQGRKRERKEKNTPKIVSIRLPSLEIKGPKSW